jgi:drug/metabolite transporter (DMT)-like permease
MRDTSNSRTGYAWVLLAVVLFSTIEVVSKAMGPARPALQIAFLRFFLAGLVLLPFAIRALRRDGKPLKRQDWILYAGLGLIGVTVGIGLYHMAVARLQANQSAILFSGNPVFVAALAPLLLKERIDRRHAGALALGVAGMACFVWDRGGPSLRTVSGVALMVASMVAFALYTVLSKKIVPRHGAIVLTAFASLFGGLILLPLTWAADGPPWRLLTAWHWLAVGFLAVFATAVAYAAYFHGLRHVKASRGSMIFFAKPVLASVLAWILLREPLGAASILGGILIISATAVAIGGKGGT